MDYVVNGALMVNELSFYDGQIKKNIIGGGAVFATEGVKLWNDKVLLLAGCGKDYRLYFSEWLDKNNLSDIGFLCKWDKTNSFYLKYHSDGSYEEGLLNQQETHWDEIDFMLVSPSEMESFCQDIKGMYITMDIIKEYWEKVYLLKQKYNFKIMWELATASAVFENYLDFVSIIKMVDIYSLNLNEARKLFGLQKEEEIIRHIIRLGVPAYFRVGIKGAYMVMDGKAVFTAAYIGENEKDPTGCGNSSTAAAMVGFVEGYSLKETAAMAAVTAAYNAKQFGPYPCFDGNVREQAWRIVKQLCNEDDQA